MEDPTGSAPPLCTGPFSDARDCPVHRPPRPLVAEVIRVDSDGVSVRWDDDNVLGFLPWAELLGCRITPPKESRRVQDTPA